MSQPFAIAIHAGAGTLVKAKMDERVRQEITNGLERAVQAGYQQLLDGHHALNAVVEAVKVLEDIPLFNAGKGSVLTHQEMVEMEAMVMYGKSHAVGAVAGLRHIKNPITLASDVLKKGKQFLIGEGAEAFAFKLGHHYTEQDYFFTEPRYQQLFAIKNAAPFLPSEQTIGAVGAVALDQFGDLAAATSTGGVCDKACGQVGGAAMLGVGALVDNNEVALSAFGAREELVKYRTTSEIAARMRYLKEDMATACASVMQRDLQPQAGVVGLDRQGEIYFAVNGPTMYRASINRQGECRIHIDPDE